MYSDSCRGSVDGDIRVTIVGTTRLDLHWRLSGPETVIDAEFRHCRWMMSTNYL